MALRRARRHIHPHMRRFITYLISFAVLIAVAGLWVTQPAAVEPTRFINIEGDVARGEIVYWAGGCGSCHAAEDDASKLILAGGRHLKSDFGTFISPNVSPGPQGIGNWTINNFANAMLHGSSPDGSHYFPAFPYTSYSRMTDQDIADLWAFMQTLPVSDEPSKPHEIGFPFNIRASVGGWKLLYLTSDFVGPESGSERGRYLVESAGHCAECHTPRSALGGLDLDRWMAGAPNPSGPGRIPGLTPTQLKWSAADIAYYLETGFTPDFDSAGGEMAQVVRNMARLSTEDREEIAAYIKSLAPAE